LIGIDVGGTFTDAVAVRRGRVLSWAKAPTDASNLARSLLSALDTVMRAGQEDLSPDRVARVGLSTTLITNLLAQGQAPKAALLLIPGPGCDPASYRLGAPYWTVDGAVDLAGRETHPLDRAQVLRALDEIDAAGYRRLGVVAKFSPRNPDLEQRALAWARERRPDWALIAGHTVSGQLNFTRRAAAAALTLRVQDAYRAFFDQIQAALSEHGLSCPIVILKADGGTLPLDSAQREPIQSVFSGPAASAMGALAQRPPGSTSVVVDVGGTTTDLALILDGAPLFSSRGGSLEGVRLPTGALAVRSLPVGGDSTVSAREGRIVLLPTRAGAAACLGGPQATLTDALRVAGRTGLGDEALARQAMAAAGRPVGLDAGAAAEQAIEQAMSRVEEGIRAMFRAWQQEQVYRIWQLKQRGERRPEVIVGVGAAAAPLVPTLAERLQARALIPPHAPVANALGAALARTTYTTTLHVDTARRRAEIAEEGAVERLPGGRYTLDDARELAREWMVRRGQERGVADPLADCEEVLAEQFNVVQGWQTVGRIMDVRLERRCGLVEGWREHDA